MALVRLSGPALASLACLTLNFCFLSIFMCVGTVAARLTAQTHLADAAQARRGAV